MRTKLTTENGPDQTCISMKQPDLLELSPISSLCNTIFFQSIADYHIHNDTNLPMMNPFSRGSLNYLLYHKNWIDTVQWHLEDLVRDPEITPEKSLEIKRRIDKLNQERTDKVETIDFFFYQQFEKVKLKRNASINTESPAWAIDRLSILHLKIFHMEIEATRKDASDLHRRECGEKLNILTAQSSDLSFAIDILLKEMRNGEKVMKVYRQMKMYNDENLNPVLYSVKASNIV